MSDNKRQPFGEMLYRDFKGKEIYAKTHGQLELVRTIDSNEITFVDGPAGSGKAQPLDSKILTPTGWVNMGDIKVGDVVISKSGRSTKVLGVYPQGKKEVFRITFHDGASAESCGEHLWACKNVLERDKRLLNQNWRIRTLHEIIDMGKKYKGKRDRKIFNIPIIDNPINFAAQTVPLDPYLLGVLLGDGCITDHAVLISSADMEIVDRVRGALPDSYSLNKLKYGYDYRISKIKRNSFIKNEIHETCKLLGIVKLSQYKFIPDIYKFNSTEVRLEVLRGLMDTDGTVSIDGRTSFSTSSSKLRDDVIFLIRSLGGIATYTQKKRGYRDKNGNYKRCLDSYELYIKLPNDIIPFHLTRKKERIVPLTKYFPSRYIEKIESVGDKDCQCIYIEDEEHLYITNDFVVTHNTFIASVMAAKYIKSGLYDKIVLVRPVVEAGESMGFLPGEISEKIAPYMKPLYEFMSQLLRTNRTQNSGDVDETGNKKKKPTKTKRVTETQQSNKDGTVNISSIIQVEPLAYMRGSTMNNTILIGDEFQNTTPSQMKMLLTRIGENSKFIITGDANQCDLRLKYGMKNGLADAMDRLYDVNDNIGMVQLTDNDIVRNKIIKDILKAYSYTHPD